MGKGIFITGSGTGVGKTLVTAGLLRVLRARGYDAVSMKPIQTGAERRGASWHSPDLALHARIAGWALGEADHAPYAPCCYALAASPHLAARDAGRPIDMEAVAQAVEAAAGAHEIVLVEGAGGVLVPLDDDAAMIDLIRRLALPVVVVAPLGLGTINHTLLTLHELQRNGIDTLGVVFSELSPGEPPEILADNPRTVARFSGETVLGVVRHDPKLAEGDATAWTRFERSMPGIAAIVAHMTAE